MRSYICIYGELLHHLRWNALKACPRYRRSLLVVSLIVRALASGKFNGGYVIAVVYFDTLLGWSGDNLTLLFLDELVGLCHL